jgi:sulfite reductase (NADPH) hemoprotein beta-component
MAQMIIANRLQDGIVVFLAAHGGWVPAIKDGLVIEGEADQQRLLATAKEHEAKCLVVDPNLIEVVVGENGPRPTAIREAIRAFGPTI